MLVKKIFGISALVGLIGGCTPFVNHRGAQITEHALKEIKINVDTYDLVRSKLGSPTTTSLFTDNTTQATKWYYIYTCTSQMSCLNPKITERASIEITFNTAGIVTSIQKLDTKHIKPITPNSNKTETTGYESSILKDIFGNFGKYSNMENKK